MKLALGDFPDGVLVIPDGVTSIGEGAFIGCEFSGDYSGGTDKYRSIKSIIIPNSVTSIGSGVFKYCTGLTSITIPDSVTSIGGRAFYDCMMLANIYYTGTQTQWKAISKVGNWNSNMGSSVTGGTKIHYNYVPELLCWWTI